MANSGAGDLFQGEVMTVVTYGVLQGRFLQNQCLVTPVETVELAADRMLGLRGAEGSTPYLSLYWRVKNFRPGDFDVAVHQCRRILRVRGPRGTYYWVSVNQAPMFIGACKALNLQPILESWGIKEREYLTIRDKVHQRLSDGTLMSLMELKASVPAHLQRRVTKRGAPPSGTLQVTLEVMQNAGEVTALKEPGFDRHWVDEYHGDRRDVTRPNFYGLVSVLYPQVAVDVMESTLARKQLLHQYIGTFGPVTVADMAWWTGWKKGEVKQLLNEIPLEAIPVTYHDQTREYWCLPDGTTDHKSEVQAVHLLPGGDSAIKGYSDFERFLLDPCPDSNLLRFNPVVLHNGIGRGNWGYRRTNGYLDVVLSLFDTPSPDETVAMETAAHRLGHFLASHTGDEVRCHSLKQTGPWRADAAFPVVAP